MLVVRGRSDYTQRMHACDGHELHVLPLALRTIIEDGAGLYDFQLVQQGPSELSLSTAAHGSDARRGLQRARNVLAAFLHDQGAASVRIHCCSGRASRIGRTGKCQRVIAAQGR